MLSRCMATLCFVVAAILCLTVPACAVTLQASHTTPLSTTHSSITHLCCQEGTKAVTQSITKHWCQGKGCLQGWEKVCSTKKMNRFHPPEVKQGLQQLDIAKEHLQAAALAAWEAFLGEFALHYAPFRGAVMALASLDALHSLATLACNPG